MTTHHRHARPAMRRERGSAMVALLVIVITCGALALSVLLPSIARHREAAALVERERAFQLAEAGLDYGIAEMRKSGGEVPATPTVTGYPGEGTSGEFMLTFSRGDTNGIDDDGDGITDDSDERDLVELVSRGTYNSHSRTIRMMLRRSVDEPTIVASIQFNVENPIVDLNGNQFLVSGFEHAIDGTEDTTQVPTYAIAAPADPANIASQVETRWQDQIVGLDGSPSITYVDAIDLDTLIEQAKAAKTHDLEPGTHSRLTLGEPTPAGVVLAVCEGDLSLSGPTTGYGILVVDGDLYCSGQLSWTGLILVRGRCDMTGGGGTKRMIGAMIVGEEVVGGINETQTVKLTGTVDMLYSTDAVQLAQNRLAVMTVLSWQEVATP